MSVLVKLTDSQIERLEVHILTLDPDGAAHIILERHFQYTVTQKHVAIQLAPTYDFEQFREHLEEALVHIPRLAEIEILVKAFREFTQRHRDKIISVNFL